jgi:hypothetical protein
MMFPVRPSDQEAKRRMAVNGYSTCCGDGAHRHSERGIHQLLSGHAETLATVYWLRRELLRRGQKSLVVRLNFVFFTDSVSELYGQRMSNTSYSDCWFNKYKNYKNQNIWAHGWWDEINEEISCVSEPYSACKVVRNIFGKYIRSSSYGVLFPSVSPSGGRQLSLSIEMQCL